MKSYRDQGQILHFSYYLILYTVIFTIFTRLIGSLGLPRIFNHFHYILLILNIFYYIYILKKSDQSLSIIFFWLNICLIVSSLINNVSKYNFIIDFLILFQPLIIILILLGINFKEEEKKFIFKILILITILNSFFVYVQYFYLGLRNDDVHGIFIDLGTAPHTAAGFNFISSLLVFFYSDMNNFKKTLLLAFFLSVIILTSTLTMFLSILITIGFMIIYKNKNFFKIVIYFSILFFGLIIILYLIKDTEIYKIRFSPEKFLIPYLDALVYKYKIFFFLNENFLDIKNLLFGLGPGHSISRLSLMIPRYDYLLDFTSTRMSEIVFNIQQLNYYSNLYTGSSFFSLFFFSAGIYGDLGIIGFLLYYLFWFRLYLINKNNVLNKLIIVNILVLSFIFQWLEEPAFICYLALILGVNFKKEKIET